MGRVGRLKKEREEKTHQMEAVTTRGGRSRGAGRRCHACDVVGLPVVCVKEEGLVSKGRMLVLGLGPPLDTIRAPIAFYKNDSTAPTKACLLPKRLTNPTTIHNTENQTRGVEPPTRKQAPCR